MPPEQPSRDRAHRQTLGRFRHKTIRLDRPDGLGPAAAGSGAASPAAEASAALRSALAETARAIRLLLTAGPGTPRSRRVGRRHSAVEPTVWVGWWLGEAFTPVRGRVVNLSRGGALISLPARPPKGEPVWVYKDAPTGLASVRGELAGATPAPGGGYAVRLRFAVPCPTPLCSAVLCRTKAGAATA